MRLSRIKGSAALSPGNARPLYNIQKFSLTFDACVIIRSDIMVHEGFHDCTVGLIIKCITLFFCLTST